jgi:hypothetical protein
MPVLMAVILMAGISYAGSQGAVRSIELPQIHIELKAGDGREKVEALCNICHSLDYITMQPRFARSQWAAVVNKMIKVMGAPINESDSKTIINYLVRNYGTGN